MRTFMQICLLLIISIPSLFILIFELELFKGVNYGSFFSRKIY